MNIRKLVTLTAAASLLALPTVALAQATFDDSTASGEGFGILKKPTFSSQFKNIEDPGTAGLVNSVITIINALLVLAAIAAIVFIIIGGVRYVTAQGDEDAVALAKNTVIYAIIGIIVILLAAVIVNFFVAQV